MKFVLDQNFRPIQPYFHVGCIRVQFHPTFGFSSMRYAVECVLNVFIDIRMRMSQTREGRKQDKREEAKITVVDGTACAVL